MDFKKLVGKRILIGRLFGSAVYEAKVLEVSPSSKYVLMEYAQAARPNAWEAAEYLRFVEELEEHALAG